MKSTTSTLPGSQTRPRSLRPRSTSIRCSARSLGSASSSSASALSSCGGRAARPGAGDGVDHRPAALDLDQRLGAGADDVEGAVVALEAEQVHVRAGVGGPQHPVDVQRARRARRLEALGGHDLERLAGADALLDVLDGVLVARRRPTCAVYGGTSDGGSAAALAAAGRARSAAIASRRATASAYASSTPVSRSLWLIALAISRTVPSQWSRTARSEVSSIVSSGSRRSSSVLLADLLQAADDVVAEVADHAAGERRQAAPSIRSRGVCSASTVARSAASGSPSVGTPTGGVPSQCACPSRSVSVAALRTPMKE